MKKWIKLGLVVLIFAIISLFIYLILNFCGLANIEKIKEIIKNSGNLGACVFCLIFVFCLVFLCFVPILSSALVVLCIVLFGPIQAFFIITVGNFISSTILFYIGDKFGENLAKKLVGKDELEKAQDLIDTKSKILLPILFIIPGIPDEALILVAGMTKMKYWYLILVSMIYHIAEIAVFCFFGSSIFNWQSLSAFEWVFIINFVVIDIYLLFKFEKFLERNNK